MGRKSHIFMLAAKAKQMADEKGKVIGKSAHLNFIQAIRNALPFAGSVEKYMEILLVQKIIQSQMQFNDSKRKQKRVKAHLNVACENVDVFENNFSVVHRSCP